jgi:diguanylate cyclase (GGDEF)-like protein
VVVVLAVLVFFSIAAIGYAALGQRASQQVQHELEHMANHDGLTGLHNRVAVNTALAEVLAARSPSGRAAVLLIELDRFASINNTYGHDVGDQLMIAAAGQIKKSLEANETIFRLGGPQFIVLAPNAITRDAAVARAQQLQNAIRVQYRIDHDHLRISATVGVVMLDQRHTSPALVLEDADSAVREATRRGLGTCAVFEVSMRAKVSAYDAESRLRQALERDEFLLMYMPVVALDDSKIVGVEALLRWADPERGVVAPGEFLELLEKTDLLEPVGYWVFTEACKHNKRWQEMFPKADIASTVNVSPAQLASAEFTSRVQQIIEETGADPARLCFEITEGSTRTNIENVWWNLRQLEELGVQLALDDFGTGYSTFDYIRKFQLDILKIDRVFVDRINQNEGDYAIVQQLISMAHSLDFVAIAEGVDNAEQASTLATMNCDLGQGYYWSQPQPLDTIEKLISRGTIRPSANRAKKIDWKAPAAPKT